MTTKNKVFDCVAMKDDAQREIYEATRDMSPAEEAEYWREKETHLKETWARRAKIASDSSR